jgi:hypothetical protein
MLNGTLMTRTSGGTTHVVGARLRFVATARVAGSALPPVYPVATRPRQAADGMFYGTNAPVNSPGSGKDVREVALGTGIIGVGLVGKKRCKRS